MSGDLALKGDDGKDGKGPPNDGAGRRVPMIEMVTCVQ